MSNLGAKGRELRVKKEVLTREVREAWEASLKNMLEPTHTKHQDEKGHKDLARLFGEEHKVQLSRKGLSSSAPKVGNLARRVLNSVERMDSASKKDPLLGMLT